MEFKLLSEVLPALEILPKYRISFNNMKLFLDNSECNYITSVMNENVDAGHTEVGFHYEHNGYCISLFKNIVGIDTIKNKPFVRILITNSDYIKTISNVSELNDWYHQKYNENANQTIINEMFGNFEPRQLMATRYANKPVDSTFYTTIGILPPVSDQRGLIKELEEEISF